MSIDAAAEASDLRVMDLHTHPTLKMTLYGRRFWKSHLAPRGKHSWTLRTDIHSLLRGQVQCVLSAVYVPERAVLQYAKALRWLPRVWKQLGRQYHLAPEQAAHEQLDLLEYQVHETRQRLGTVVEIATDYTHLRQIASQGHVAIVNSMEGAHHLEGDLDALDRFARRGVAHLIIAHFCRNEACGSVDGIPDNDPVKRLALLRLPDESDSGLTPWGHELINKMWDVGIIVDMTHATPRCRTQILDESQKHSKRRPVIMSHVGLHQLAPFPMNPTNDEIRRIADTGGVIGLIAMPWWLSKPPQPRCLDVVTQSIDHLIRHGGEDVVAFGSDFDGFTTVPRDWRSPKDYPSLCRHLLSRYSQQQIEKIAWRNADRVLREGWG